MPPTIRSFTLHKTGYANSPSPILLILLKKPFRWRKNGGERKYPVSIWIYLSLKYRNILFAVLQIFIRLPDIFHADLPLSCIDGRQQKTLGKPRVLKIGCGSRIRTYDLRVMSPTSYHAAPSRVRRWYYTFIPKRRQGFSWLNCL